MNREYWNFIRKIVTGYLDKFPKTPSTTLARMMVRDNPGVWKDTESARAMIRKMRGALGQESFNQLKDKSYAKYRKATGEL